MSVCLYRHTNRHTFRLTGELSDRKKTNIGRHKTGSRLSVHIRTHSNNQTDILTD